MAKRPRIDKSQLLYGEPARIREQKYLDWIATLACCMFGRYILCQGDVVYAHLRMGSKSGTGQKPGDDCVTPCCDAHHKLQHQKGEIWFWSPYNPSKLCADLWDARYNDVLAARIIRAWRAQWIQTP